MEAASLTCNRGSTLRCQCWLGITMFVLCTTLLAGLLMGARLSTCQDLEAAILDLEDAILHPEDVGNRILSGLLSACVAPPRTCPNRNVTFYLYTRLETPPHVLDPSNLETLSLDNFKIGKPIKIIIHGYSTSYNDVCNRYLRPAYFSTGEYNIISVDWAPLTVDGCYPWAAWNVPLVAQCSAQMIDLLVTTLGIPLAAFHVIGYSMGAHVAGNIRHYLKSGRLDRITGLDPAKPLYVGVPDAFKLDASDAIFVDVIHTNGGLRGKMEPSGHVDIYVNGGISQPGCWDLNPNSASSCAHNRVPRLFAESIYSQAGFWSYPCPDQVIPYALYIPCTWRARVRPVLMGEYIDRSARGIYFLETNARPPYARGRRTWEAPWLRVHQGLYRGLSDAGLGGPFWLH